MFRREIKGKPSLVKKFESELLKGKYTPPAKAPLLMRGPISKAESQQCSHFPQPVRLLLLADAAEIAHCLTLVTRARQTQRAEHSLACRREAPRLLPGH